MQGQTALAGIAAEVLGVTPETLTASGHRASFVRLGGTSLRAAELIARLEDRLGLTVPIDLLLGGLTLAEALGAAAPMSSAPSADTATLATGALSDGQAAMLVGDELPGGSPFHLLFSTDLRGPVDLGRLTSAIRTVVDTHDALRTMFVNDNGRLGAIVVPTPAGDQIAQVLDDIDPADPITAIHQALKGASKHVLRPFERPPAVFYVSSIGPDRVVVTLLVHHAIADGSSIGTMWRCLATAYAGKPVGTAPPASTLTALETTGRAGELLARRVAALAGLPTALSLPSDLRRPAVADRHGARLTLSVPADIVRACEELARNLGTTRNAVLVAAWSLVIARRTGLDRFVAGLSASGRTSAASLATVGLGTKLLPMRCLIAGDLPVSAHVRATAAEISGALSAMEVPFERIVAQLGAAGDPSRNPLAQVGFAAHDELVPAELAFGEGMTATTHEGHCGGTVFDAFLYVQRWTPQGARLAIEYATSALLPTEATRLGRELLTTVALFAEAPDRTLGDIDTRSPGDVTIERGWSTGRYVDGTDADLWALFAASAHARPDAVAVRAADGRTLTYRQLAEAAEDQAARLADLGVGDRDRVVIAVPRSAAEIVGVLATLRLGAAFVGIDADHPQAVLSSYLDIAGAAAAIADPGAFAALAAAHPGLPACPPSDPWTAGSERARAGLPTIPEDPGRDAYAAFTSGSTGRPKAVRVPHRAVVRLVRDPDFLTAYAASRFLRLAPLAFDASTLEIFAPLAAGGTIEIFPDQRTTVEALDTFLTDRRVTGAWLTSGLFRLLADHRPNAFRQLTQLLTGGDIVPPEQVRRVLRACPDLRITNGYGPTENTTFTTTYHMASLADVGEPVPIGRPIQGGGVDLVDASGRSVPAGAIGELAAWGDGLSAGYLNDPEATAAAFRVSPAGRRRYHTGDLARWRLDGTIEFVGRADKQIKVRGFRVELDAVRRALAEYPGVRDVVVAATEAGPGDKCLVAGIVAGPDVHLAAVRAHADRRLPGYAVPSLWAVVDAFPITHNGKLDVAALTAAARPAGVDSPDPADAGDGSTRTVEEIEDVIAAVWEKVLGTADFGYDDRFFDVGGDSMQLIHVRTQLRDSLATADVSVLDLLRYPTITELAGFLYRGGA